MNWKAIKHIYYCVLVADRTIEYLGDSKYKISYWWEIGQQYVEVEYKNEKFHGKHIGLSKTGRKLWEYNYKDGEKIL